MKVASLPLLQMIAVAGGLAPVLTMVAVCSAATSDETSHAAVSGYFTVEASGLHAEGGPGESCFDIGGKGYVLRGTGRGVRNDWLVADSDGKLAKSEGVVTSAFG